MHQSRALACKPSQFSNVTIINIFFVSAASSRLNVSAGSGHAPAIRGSWRATFTACPSILEPIRQPSVISHPAIICLPKRQCGPCPGRLVMGGRDGRERERERERVSE